VAVTLARVFKLINVGESLQGPSNINSLVPAQRRFGLLPIALLR